MLGRRKRNLYLLAHEFQELKGAKGCTHPRSRSTPPRGSPDTTCTLYSRNSSHQTDGTGTAPAQPHTHTQKHTGLFISGPAVNQTNGPANTVRGGA